MTDKVVTNIKQIITSFEMFITLYENQGWIKTLTTESIKNAFKLASFIERAVIKLKSKGCCVELIRALHESLTAKNWTKVYSEQFYENACDQLLTKFFMYKNLNVNHIDIAIRMYTSLNPKQRLQNFLSNLFLLTSSYKSILDFTLTNEEYSNLQELNFHLLLTNWRNEYTIGKFSFIKESVASMLNVAKVESTLPILMGILSLTDISDESDKILIKFLLETILSRMVDRSILSKSFWLAIFAIDKCILGKVCLNFNDFLVSLVNFIIYIGSMMDSTQVSDEIKWVADPHTSLCPEISYDNILEMIKSLCQFNISIKNYILDKIKVAAVNTSPLFWTQVLEDLSLH